jgi:hypothetical protein
MTDVGIIESSNYICRAIFLTFWKNFFVAVKDDQNLFCHPLYGRTLISQRDFCKFA